MTCPECEYNKARASLWRNESYKQGGAALPWDADVVLAKAVLTEREACALLCETMGAEGYGTLAIAAEIRRRK